MSSTVDKISLSCCSYVDDKNVNKALNPEIVILIGNIIIAIIKIIIILNTDVHQVYKNQTNFTDRVLKGLIRREIAKRRNLEIDPELIFASIKGYKFTKEELDNLVKEVASNE